VGTTFTPTLVVEQYELLPSNPLRLVREYALDFGAVGGGVVTGGPGVPQDLELFERLLSAPRAVLRPARLPLGSRKLLISDEPQQP
jgi:hypothetical protein